MIRDNYSTVVVFANRCHGNNAYDACIDRIEVAANQAWFKVARVKQWRLCGRLQFIRYWLNISCKARSKFAGQCCYSYKNQTKSLTVGYNNGYK